MAVAGKKIGIAVILGVLFGAGALIIIPWFLNPAYLKSLALQQVQQTFGSHVMVGDTTLTLFPRPSLSIADIVVKERAESHAVFRARLLRLELGIGQLLQKKLVVHEFALDHPEIEIHRDESGEWRFLGRTHGDSPVAPLAKFLVLGKLMVTNGRVIVIDESPKDTVRGVVVERLDCSTEGSVEDGALSAQLELSGLLRQNRKSASFALQGRWTGALKTAEEGLHWADTVFDRVSFAGAVRAQGLEVDYWAEYIPHGEQLTTYRNALDLGTEIKWVQEAGGSQLHLTDVLLSSSDLTVAGNANIEELEDGNHMVGMSLRSPDVDLRLIRTYVPTDLIPEPLQAVWSQDNWGGHVQITDARLIGSSRPDVQTSVAGTFGLKNVYFEIPDWGRATRVNGTLIMEADRIQLNGGHGIYDSIPVEVTEGVVLLKDSGPWADVEIQGPVPADRVVAVMKKLRGTRGAIQFMKDWKWTQGEGPLRLRFAGNVEESDGIRFQEGEFAPLGAMVEIPGVSQPLTQIQGNILFGREKTVFDNLRGLYGNNPMTVTGSIVYQQAPRFEDLKILGVVEAVDLWRVAQGVSVEHPLPVQGPLGFSLLVSGSAGEPNLKGIVEANDVLIDIPGIFHKEPGREGTLEFEGQVRGDGNIRMDRVEFNLLPLRIQGRGMIQVTPVLAFDGRIDSGPIYVGLLPDGVNVLGEYLQSGILEIQLGLRGRGNDWKKWQSRGWVALTEGVVTARGVPHALTNVFVRLKIDRSRLEVKRAEFRIHDSEAVLTGMVNRWMESPQISLMMDSPGFDLDLLIPKKERSVVRDAIEWLAAHGTLEGSVNIERPRYKNLNGEKLSGAVKIHDNLVSVDKVQMMVEEVGTFEGRFFIHLPEGKPGAMRASFQTQDIPFDKLLILVGDDKRDISGKLSVKGMIQGHGRNEGGVIPSLSGNLDVTVKEGYVRRGTVLPRILAILNLPNVLRGKEDFENKGFPFTKVTATLQVDNGTFSSKDLYLNSSIMKVTAAGSYDLQHDRLDAVAAVSPFGAYSTLLQKIPLFGRIFAGERKGLATAIFSLTGPLGQANVTYLPGESFKTGITGLAQLAFDVLKNTLTLPYDLLNDSIADSQGEGQSSSGVEPKEAAP